MQYARDIKIIEMSTAPYLHWSIERQPHVFENKSSNCFNVE